MKTKQELQLATIETASALFHNQVVEPALGAGIGLERLRALADRFLAHVESGVYPGGCFFASVAAEMDTRTGPVHDHAVALGAGWLGQLETAARDAQAEGAIDRRRIPSSSPSSSTRTSSWPMRDSSPVVIRRPSTEHAARSTAGSESPPPA